MNTAFNRRHHLNKRCIVLSRDSIYTVNSKHYMNPIKNGKHVNVRAWFHMRDCMWFPNATKRTPPCSDWYECESDGQIYIFMTWFVTVWIQPSDSSVQAGFPKKNRSQGERGVQNKCCNVTYANTMSHTAYMESRLKTDSTRSMRIRQKIENM